MHNNYRYEGPLPLGSTVAHSCAGAGLFAAEHGEPVRWHLIGSEEGSAYVLRLCGTEGESYTFTGEISSEGRKAIGKEVLYCLREQQGMERIGKWGSLVGVRPTKLFHKLWDEVGYDEAGRVLSGDYDVSEEKLHTLADIATLQRPLLKRDDGDRHVAVYGGIPFCESRCTYCSFPFGLIGEYHRIEDFVQAYLRDAEHLAQQLREFRIQADCLYVGGGTPTSLPEEMFAKVLAALRPLCETGREFTVEAGRPDSITVSKLDAMMKYGVTRISINPQSMQNHILRAVGRAHTAEAIEELYRWVRKRTDWQVNMDFIAGLPQQTTADMKENMDFICRTLPENVTIHTLALKKGSPLYAMRDSAALPDEDTVAYMVAYAGERLRAAGYVPYYLYRQKYMTGQLENIGYTLPSYACEYNIRVMEERQSVLAVGPGSSSKWMRAPDYRQLQLHTPKDVSVYIDTLEMLLQKRRQRCEQFWEA